MAVPIAITIFNQLECFISGRLSHAILKLVDDNGIRFVKLATGSMTMLLQNHKEQKMSHCSKHQYELMKHPFSVTRFGDSLKFLAAIFFTKVAQRRT